MQDDLGDPKAGRDFTEFAAGLEAEYPALAERRKNREEGEAFVRSVGEALRAARGDLSRAEVAHRMGVMREETVARLENGDLEITVEALFLYAHAVGCVPRVYLVPRDGD